MTRSGFRWIADLIAGCPRSTPPQVFALTTPAPSCKARLIASMTAIPRESRNAVYCGLSMPHTGQRLLTFPFAGCNSVVVFDSANSIPSFANHPVSIPISARHNRRHLAWLFQPGSLVGPTAELAAALIRMVSIVLSCSSVMFR